MAISGATLGIRRPVSTTFVDIFKGYNFVVYTKTKFGEEVGQKRQRSEENGQCQIRGRGRRSAVAPELSAVAAVMSAVAAKRCFATRCSAFYLYLFYYFIIFETDFYLGLNSYLGFDY